MRFFYSDCRLIFTPEDAQAREARGEWLALNFNCPTGRGMIIARFGQRTCEIHRFDITGAKRRGSGRATLQALRQFFDIILIPDPLALDFWNKMRDEGLVQTLFSDYVDETEASLVFYRSMS
jgi:hypothetical protein